jgi:predicted HD phosphohydrolase
MLTAEQSTEVTKEHQDHRAVGPEVTESSLLPGEVLELYVAERRDVHAGNRTVRHGPRTGASATLSASARGKMASMTTATTFTRMDQSTAEQWAVIGKETMEQQDRVAEGVLAMLRSLATITDGFAVDQLTHSLQTATLAERAGADDEIVVASLCHDIGKAVSVPNHPKIAAEILKSYVRDDVYQMIRAHQDFQGRHYYHHFGGDPDAREQYRGASWFALAEQFADEWDQIAFDPDYDTLPLEHFEDRVRAVFASPHSL